MRRDTISLYWWRKAGMVNLGDELGRNLVEFVSGKKVVAATLEEAELLAVGSIINFPQNDLHLRKTPYLVWGSGSLNNAARTQQESFVCSAVRGPLTFSLLERHRDIPFGDPGILTSAMWPHDGTKSYRWGLVPHYSHLSQPWVSRVLEKTPNAVLIDVRDPDIEASCRKIASCDFIAATSLHGLIIADSYGVPSLWLTDGGVNNSWKYFDYFGGVNRRNSPAVAMASQGDLTGHEEKLGVPRHFTTLPGKMKQLAAAFPL